MRRKLVLLVVGALALGSVLVASPPSSAAPPTAGPTVFVGQLTPDQLAQLSDTGLDHGSVVSKGQVGDKVAVEVVLTRLQAGKLTALGLPLTEKRVAGTTASRRMNQQAANGYEVYRSYSEAGGIRDEFRQLARDYPRLTKLVTIGKTVQGQDIVAMKVTRDARSLRDGQRPAVLYSSAQHAREWITPEMNRRLLHYVLEGYATTAATRRIVDTRELWFVPVANPDGYDFTFTQDNRLWRKNLRDNDGDGVITGLDGVDLNRNFPTRWGYDNEGSSPAVSSETYRGTAPRSEPETRALDDLMKRVRLRVPDQLPLGGRADPLRRRLPGGHPEPGRPAVRDPRRRRRPSRGPGLRPGHLGRALHDQRGDHRARPSEIRHARRHPEMSTCETASAVDPDDAFDPADCESGFNFPDSEALIQAEFEKNLPFALAIARSAGDPDDPVSVVGRTAPDFAVDTFATSYGDPQPVAVTARRDLKNLRLHFSVNGRRAREAPVREWRGGERYGADGDVYYAEYRGVVRGAKPGDRVSVWFTGNRPGKGRRTSERFTYRLAEDTRNRVLVVANEDYEGVNPTYPASVTSPKYAGAYVAALRAQGYRASVWDVSKRGVPHHLGVLGHFDAVVWYLGDNRLTQDPEDELTRVGNSDVRNAAVAERQQYLTLAVRDYLNEGGKLVHTGETAGYFGALAGTLGGIWYGLDGDPTADCVVTQDLFSDCLLLADDFFQYYLGVNSRSTVDAPTGFAGKGRIAGTTATFGGPALADNPLDEPGALGLTSDVLPPEDFPLFASASAGTYSGAAGGAFDPVEGDWYVGAVHTDDTYARLSRTVDLTGATAAQNPQLRTQISYDVEGEYDHVIVEAHPVGSDAWTTLPEAGGLTTTTLPAECDAGFLIEEHPFLTHYLTLGDPCLATGTTGAWNAMTGSSGGWQTATFDLSAYAGQQVEVVISYVTDPSTGGIGVVVDDTALLVGGQVVDSEGFETGLGPWRVADRPAGSPSVGTDFQRSEGLQSSAVSTRDTITFGFGLEQIGPAAERAAVLGKAVRSLIGRP